ncbi:MAG TPA: hypothetical protein VJ063_20865 [Verrucomicrobiae bacterium]|nr:hypothetical protein [Verrucomicrobiae bacterium]
MKALIVVILVAVAAYLGYRIISQPKPAKTTIAESQPAMQPTAAPSVAVQEKASAPTNVTRPGAASNKATVAGVKDPATKPTGEWKAKMQTILSANTSAQQKIDDLKEMLSKLAEAEAEEAVRDLTTRVKNEGYAFLKPLTVDPNLPEPVRDEFMVDLMNRPNSLRIPLFLEIARNPDHPDHESAFDTLEAFTGLKYGADWDGWEKGIQQWLKENPDRIRQPDAPAAAEVN